MVVSIFISGLLLEAVRIGSSSKNCLKIQGAVHEPLSEVSVRSFQVLESLLVAEALTSYCAF
jgi:hypothetical protein